MSSGGGKKPAGQDEGFIGPISRFWSRSYAPDYLGFALLLVAYSLVRLSLVNPYGCKILMFLQIEVLVEPFHRMFSLDNISIQYPHAAVERVSVSMKAFGSFLSVI